MDLRAHEGGAVMLVSQCEQRMKEKNFFLLRNEIFDLKLNQYEFHIYAYLIRIEDRSTYQCVAEPHRFPQAR